MTSILLCALLLFYRLLVCGQRAYYSTIYFYVAMSYDGVEDSWEIKHRETFKFFLTITDIVQPQEIPATTELRSPDNFDLEHQKRTSLEPGLFLFP